MGVPYVVPVRPQEAASPRRREVRSCSCELLGALSTDPAVSELLLAGGLDPRELGKARAIHEHLEPEPADWALRLASRGLPAPGPDASGLTTLLAFVRNADCHAYQVLERLGATPAILRKSLIERLREHGGAADSGLRTTTQTATQTTTQTRTSRGSHPRLSTTIRPPGLGPHPTDRLRTAYEETEATAVADETNRGLGARAEPDSRPELASRPSLPKPSRGQLAPIDASAIPALIGRHRELARLADALLRQTRRPPLLVGPHGSGRTLLASHLGALLRRDAYRLSAPSYEDDQRLRDDLRAIADANGVAIFDDVDAVSSEGTPPWMPALTEAWLTHEPPVVTVVSHEGKARLSTWLPGILDALDVLVLEGLRGHDAYEAVRSAAPSVLARHGTRLENEAVLADLIRIADRELGGLAMPGRAIDLLDLSCARTVREGKPAITRGTFQALVSEATGLPLERLERSEERVLLDLERELQARVVGHEHAISTIARLVRRNRAGFAGERPIATVLLLGPSGVGKTELAKALCSALFDDPAALVRLDMSEYAESHSIARIVGAPPGYVGHESGGALTSPLLDRPHRVILLDEIEKAHRDVHQLLLQVFDEGRLTDGRGRVIDFHHTIVVMTSNLGAERLLNGAHNVEEVLLAAREAFPVELWNRIEAPLVLAPLSHDELCKVTRRLARASNDRLFRERGIRYQLSEDACHAIVSRGASDPALGARPLRHVLAHQIESLVAEAILRGELRPGDEAVVCARGSDFLVHTQPHRVR